MGSLARKKSNPLAKYTAKEALLRPLPIDSVMEGFKEHFEKEQDLKPDSTINIDHIFTAICDLRDSFNERFRFHDWEYELNAIHKWDGIPSIRLELLAKKQNLEMDLLINLSYADEYGLADYEPDDTYENDYGEGYSAKTGLDFLFDFFKEVNENIIQWNNICKNNRPIINAEPPVEDIYDYFSDVFFEEVVGREWDYYNDRRYDYVDFAHFMEEHDFSPASALFEPIYEGREYWPFGDNPEFYVEFLMMDLGSDYYGYLFLETIIAIKGVEVAFYVDQREYSKGNDLFTADEVEQIYRNLTDDIWRRSVQWNRLMKGR